MTPGHINNGKPGMTKNSTIEAVDSSVIWAPMRQGIEQRTQPFDALFGRQAAHIEQ